MTFTWISIRPSNLRKNVKLVCSDSAAGAPKFALLLLMLALNGAIAQPSVYDPSFQVGTGTDGAVYAMAVQDDQRVLIGGLFTTISGQSNSFLARLSADGVVDTAFNPAGATDNHVTCLTRQPDGKILVGGAFTQLLGHPCRGVGRLMVDGSFDETFSAGTLLGDTGIPYAVAVQLDGRILIGYRLNPADYTDASDIIRVDTNGSLDNSFSFAATTRGHVLAFLYLLSEI